MADSWTTPATYATSQNVGAADLNLIRDNLDALKAGQTDSSADSDIRLSPKVGTFAARPAASGGTRLYYASDYRTMFWSDGTNWYHLTGRGAYDSFERANANPFDSAPEQTADSGHSWAQATGTQQLLTNGLQAVTLSGSNSIASLETGGLIETGQYVFALTTGATVASINIACVLKYINSSTYLYVQLHGTAGFRILAGATPIATLAFTPAASTSYSIIVNLNGSYVTAQLMSGSSFVGHIAAGAITTVYTPYTTATKVGILWGTAAHDRCEAFAFKPN